MPTATLTRQRCWIHLEREAAARCPACTHFYCRECVTEHEGRVICAACLRDLLAKAAARRRELGAGTRRVLAGLVRAGQLAVSVLLAWVFFQQLGHWLLTTTAQFHEAVVWKEQIFGGGSSGSRDEDEGDKADKKNKHGGGDSDDDD